MSRKRRFVNRNSGKKFEEIFDAFVVAKTAKGVSDITIRNYHQNLHNISLHFDISIEELELLLKKPDKNCDFCEYRSWAIVNFLLNSGCRAATVRNIQNRDVDLEGRQVVFRHTKSGRIQVSPSAL